jgi:hypothetical protein
VIDTNSCLKARLPAVVYALAVVAALIVAGGEVVQQRLAAQAPRQDNLSPRLLLWLVRRPRWLAGVACSFAGDLAFSGAVGSGSVIKVEAVFTVRLVFGLLIAAAWGLHRIPVREALAATAITAGLVVFLFATRPRAGSSLGVGGPTWALGIGSVAVLALGLTLVARRLTSSSRALLLGVAAGVLFGLQASLMKRSVQVLAHSGVLALLGTWSGYAVVAAALSGMLLLQSAFNTAPLAASYPGAVSGQLLCSIAIGIAVLGGSFRLGAVALAVGAAALLVLLVGVVLLARSPLVTGAHGRRLAPGRRGPAPATAPTRDSE